MPTITMFIAGVITGFVCGATLYIAFSSFGADRTETVFVYSTLLHPLTRTYACRCLVGTEPAILPGYEKIGRTIIPNPSTQVDGALLHVSLQEIAAIDRYERTPEYYTRTRITVADKSAWVYIKVE